MKNIVGAVFEKFAFIVFRYMVATLKKRDIQKMKKSPGDINTKVPETKFHPNRTSRSRVMSVQRKQATDRRIDKLTDKHMHIKKPFF